MYQLEDSSGLEDRLKYMTSPLDTHREVMRTARLCGLFSQLRRQLSYRVVYYVSDRAQ